jgi:predicted metalloprotease with PDZ domain
MTNVTLSSTNNQLKILSTISYRVAMSNPESHLFEVTLQIKNWTNSTVNLKMPVWTPGSYLVREYARLVQNFSAVCSQTKIRLFHKKISKNHWLINTESVTDITVNYRVFANDLTVRTNHLDGSHGYFNGAALFFFIPSLEKLPLTVTIIPPKDNWRITTSLPLIEEQSNTYFAEDFDTLVDSPFEIGIHQLYEFEVLNKKHQLAIWGEGNTHPEKIIQDLKKLIKTEAEIFDGLPYQNYVFLLHLSGNGYGGLEHKNSCTLNYPRLGFRAQDQYNRFIQLVAHEFFHLWNVKRIRPQALESFDYEQENYTTSLWFSEGTTSYYDIVIPRWAKIYDTKTCLENFSKDITRFLQTPGRKFQSLTESSFDAWIQLYRRDANSDNCQISYYLKGELVSLLLDLLIRSRSHNQRSLNQVMGKLWENFGKTEIGFSEQQLKAIIESVAEIDLTDFFARYLEGTEDLPFNQYLEPFGLTLKPIMEPEAVPNLGIRVQSENGKEIIKFVDINSPASNAGIDAEDELLAIDNLRITTQQLNERLKDYQTGDKIKVTVFHQDQLRTFYVELREPQPSRYEIVQIQNPSESQKQNLARWLG